MKEKSINTTEQDANLLNVSHYDALISSGVKEEEARRAAIEVAKNDARLQSLDHSVQGLRTYIDHSTKELRTYIDHSTKELRTYIDHSIYHSTKELRTHMDHSVQELRSHIDTSIAEVNINIAKTHTAIARTALYLSISFFIMLIASMGAWTMIILRALEAL